MIGLNAFVSSSSASAGALLGSLNVFDVWYVALLAIGLRTLGLERRGAAVAVAVGFWATATALQTGMLAIADGLTRLA